MIEEEKEFDSNFFQPLRTQHSTVHSVQSGSQYEGVKRPSIKHRKTMKILDENTSNSTLLSDKNNLGVGSAFANL